MAAEKFEHKDTSNDLFLIDGSGYIFRAYFALPQNLTNPAGQPVGAVLGFCNMLYKLLNDLKAENIAVIFDAARKNFRFDIYPEYKAHRPDAPEDLIPQFPLFRKAAEAFGLPAIELEGYEADDLIATYARQAQEKGMNVTIVGSDKDLMQLVNDRVTMFDPLKQTLIDAQAVQEKFGVPPEQMVDLQALTGDSVDNVPGVPGIGPKTAAQLLGEFGSLENLLDNLDSIKQPKRRDVLKENTEQARLSKRLVTLAQDAAVPVSLEQMSAHDRDMPQLQAFLEEQGFRSLLARLTGNTPAQNSKSPESATTLAVTPLNQSPVSESRYVLVQEEAALKALIAEIQAVGSCVIDTETTHLTPRFAKLVGLSLSCKAGEAYYIPLGHIAPEADLLGGPQQEIRQLDPEVALSLLKPVLEDPSILKTAHNAKYDLQILMNHGLRVAPLEDTMLMSYVLDGSFRRHNMDALSEDYLGHTPISYEEVAGKGKKSITFDQVPLDKACAYAAEDADVTLRLHQILKPRLVQEHMVSVYEDIERPLIPVVAAMEYAGIKVDPVLLKKFSQDFGQQLLELEKTIHRLAGRDFNVASPKQLGNILFEEMSLPGGKKTKTGDWSTDVSTLEKLADSGIEIVKEVLEYRQLAKLKSTYTDALQEAIHPQTKRVHTSFSMVGTSTGRLSSSDPNLQNIPIRTELGRTIRETFIAEEGHLLLSVDYSQIELRLAAELAGISALKTAFRNKEDIHALTASQVFNIPLSEMTPEIRRRAKAINFGIIYGISGWGLAKQLGIEASEANEFIRAYLARFPELQDFMERTKEEARKNGYVKTYFGRKCYTPTINDKNPMKRQGAERAAINAPLQGTAADIIKKAMIKLARAQERGELGSSRMLLQVHDELIFEVPAGEVEQRAVQIKQIMEHVVSFDVPLEAEAGWGKSWATAH
ncbi:MAG: DNA polymerase I [Rhodospirillales bacterium]|nr:DNA polymerase I [Rhodospirillales bacterium]